MKIKQFFSNLLIACGLVSMLTVLVISVPQIVSAARSQFGLTGIYNASAITLSNGEGAALAVDSAGRLLVSTTTPISVAFSTTAPTSIAYASSTSISIWSSLYLGNIVTTTINGNSTSTFQYGINFAANSPATTTIYSNGEVSLGGTFGDAANRVLCKKSDNTVGTCSSIVGVDGTCTCQ